MMKFYYRVTVGNDYQKVTSLAKAKKLVKGQEQWSIGKFKANTTNCVGVVSPDWIEKVKGQEGVYYKPTSCGQFTMAFMKSRIAK